MSDVHLDFSDIQGNILRGYGFPAAAYIFVRVDGEAEGRAWVGELVDPVTTNEEWSDGKPDWALNVAFTCAGLEALGVPATVIDSFPTEFREGMAARAADLGDIGLCSPEHWDEGLGTGDAHVLVTINARTQEALDERIEWLRSRIERSQGLKVVHEQIAAILPLAREHFGFSDGMAQPSIEGDRLPNRPGMGIPESRGRWRPLRAGEFILGYEDEDGGLPDAPAPPLGKNGTFMVYRKLSQDVALFRETIKSIGERYPGGPEVLAAKIVGRWPDGTSLVHSPDKPDASISGDPEKINDFRYDDDPDGLRCPLGAHVRRVYPRDALGWGGNMSTRHRMIRRGMPYGPPLPASKEDDGVDRGLVFICFQADIKRQFEVVQGQWINDGNAFALGHDKDYLLGDPNGTGKMTIQGNPPFFVSPQPSFVTTKGGEYLFMPGITALKALAEGISEPQTGARAGSTA